MSQRPHKLQWSASSTPAGLCPSCSAPLRQGARYCSQCGTDTETAGAREGIEDNVSRGWQIVRLGGALLGLALVALLLVGYLDARSAATKERHARAQAIASLRARVTTLEQELDSLAGQSATLAQRLHVAEKSSQGFAPLAKRVLQSVFSIDVPDGGGSGFAAWVAGGATYVITASHVVAGWSEATVRRRGSSWTATVLRVDRTNDLALLRVSTKIAPPLWAHANLGISPVSGDQLLLVGSPFGLEGTVTTGIVSRVSYREIQTDAAANPGNSGGPALDADGNVVGVLISGGGENLNFAIPIQRACVTLRAC